MKWDESRLHAVQLAAAECPDACSADVISLVTEVRRLRYALSDIQFDLINCHQAAGRNACEHIQDAIKIVNRTLKEN